MAFALHQPDVRGRVDDRTIDSAQLAPAPARSAAWAVIARSIIASILGRRKATTTRRGRGRVTRERGSM